MLPILPRASPRSYVRAATQVSPSRSGGGGFSRGDPEKRIALPTRSIAPHQTDKAALHFDAVRAKDARLKGLVCGFQRDRGAAPTQPFQCDFFVVDKRDDDDAVIRRLGTLDDDGIAVENAGVDHAVAGDFERVMLASARK